MNRLNIFAAMLCMAIILGLTGPAAAADAPAPGTVIDKNNIDQYKDYFPDFWLDAFHTGFNGFLRPLSITIKETTPNPMPAPFLAASELNKGKYGIDAEGYITGGSETEIVGYPFPQLEKNDPQFAQKLMWNYDYKYTLDDMRGHFINFELRKGGKISTSEVENWLISFQNRMYDDPKPLYETPQGYRNANLIRNLAPAVQRNFLTLLIRYIDQKAADTTYLYLPSMRRVLRGEAGERSTPIMSSTQAPDDFFGFSGRIPEFTYTLLADQKAIGMADHKMNFESTSAINLVDTLPIQTDGWEARDVYVVEVMAKNDKYPQGRKVLWIDKETMTCLYAAAWDRAGKLWKVWQIANSKETNNSGQGTSPYATNLGFDLQLGYAVQMIGSWKLNGNGITDADISIAALRKLGR